MKNLKEEELRQEMSERRLLDWELKSLSIRKTFMFKDFVQAMSFMNQCAEVAEELNHHPDWHNVYNQVDITLNTHETGGITLKDMQLAEAFNKIYTNYK
ncbi:MAG: 4a-hydroxytetrahydrobiopterin dehydratase [Bacteroidetes bacterium]|nr:4a-hydroxytetrahydrobiopterin dehydratase [Bacteroidota bacterium]